MEKLLRPAWEMIWGKLFRPETGLFYDYCSELPELGHLPSPEEIARNFPNPCGLGTGMEDSMLSAGAVMDVLGLRRELVHDPDAVGQAEAVLAGICRAATVHGMPGFLARSVCPVDGKSCYINSSRDQFTLGVYGAWRFLRHFPDASLSARDAVRELLVSVARYCERVVTAGNEYNLLRLDGKPALVSKVWEAAPHEMLRLPMFYAAAWEATGDEHWRGLALRYAHPGIAATLTMDQAGLWFWDITVSQMQISLAVLDAIDFGDAELHRQYRTAMRMTSRHAAELLEQKLIEAERFSGDWIVHAPDWRTCKMRTCTVPEIPTGDGVYYGLRYDIPVRPAEFHQVMELTRSLGNLVFTLSLDPSTVIPPETRARWWAVLERMDFANMAADGVIQLLQGAYSMKEMMK